MGGILVNQKFAQKQAGGFQLTELIDGLMRIQPFITIFHLQAFFYHRIIDVDDDAVEIILSNESHNFLLAE